MTECEKWTLADFAKMVGIEVEDVYYSVKLDALAIVNPLEDYILLGKGDYSMCTSIDFANMNREEIASQLGLVYIGSM